ncbi:T9SS type A sorting domain-containing protein [bacterium]|nr:T9SS type A sorting domain-containing protein [bacterium]
MTRKLMMIFLAVGILTTGSAIAQYTGSVVIDSVDGEPGVQVVVPIRLAGNNDLISGMMIPIRFNDAAMTLDSVSFVETIVPAGFSAQVNYDPYSDGWIISVVPPISATPPVGIDTVSGLICKAFFVMADPLAPGTYEVDSVNVDSLFGGVFHKWRRVEFSTPDARTLLPGFESGQVFVRVSTGVGDDLGPTGLPTDFALAQNYPNPFNPSTVIEFSLPTAGRVSLSVYNILGQEVSRLVDRRMEAGIHQVTFDASDRPSGVYFYRLSHPDGSVTKKMTFVK